MHVLLRCLFKEAVVELVRVCEITLLSLPDVLVLQRLVSDIDKLLENSLIRVIEGGAWHDFLRILDGLVIFQLQTGCVLLWIACRLGRVIHCYHAAIAAQTAGSPQCHRREGALFLSKLQILLRADGCLRIVQMKL